jgi:hypothetical protein
MSRPELLASPQWRRTGNVYFPVAAAVDGTWWVLRINNYPDHPVWTLFVDGVRRFDIDDTPPTWGQPYDPTAPSLDANTTREILLPIEDSVAYGSEVGQPCDNPVLLRLTNAGPPPAKSLPTDPKAHEPPKHEPAPRPHLGSAPAKSCHGLFLSRVGVAVQVGRAGW